MNEQNTLNVCLGLGHSCCGIITNGFPANWNLQKPVNKLFAVETIHAEER